ncbi:MAG: ammonium transporter [Pseudomonadota bacterium]
MRSASASLALAVLLSGLFFNTASAQSSPPEVSPPAAVSDNAPQEAQQAAPLTMPMIVEPAATTAPELATAEPLSKPTLVDASKISAGDTAWVLAATALVLLMTIPGLALFYAGMVRKKNVLATMAHSFVITCLITVIWVVIGYSLAFTPGSPYIGGLDRVLLHGMEFMKEAGKVTVSEIAPTIPESVFIMFQMTFAIITPALITGAFAERMKFSALLMFITLWSIFVYAPVAHWVWEPGGWLAARGILDFAGGTVVHINAGVSGLVAAVIIGPRLGFGKEPMPPHNLVLTVIGACMLWVGWFGFNAGSAVAADGRAGMAMLVTQIATAVGALSWMFIEWIRRGKPSVLGLVSGAVSGLVAITPASGFVDVTGALVIGVAAGLACYWGATTLKSKLGYDDSLDVFGVHAIGGIVGALLTGVFAVQSIGGAQSSFGNQAFGVIVTVVFSAVMTALILGIVSALVGLRVTPEAEIEGLDLEQHGEHVL